MILNQVSKSINSKSNFAVQKRIGLSQPIFFLLSRRLLITCLQFVIRYPQMIALKLYQMVYYDDFVISVLSRNYFYSVENVEALLLSHKEIFDKHNIIDFNPLQVNLTTTPQPSNTKPCLMRFSNKGKCSFLQLFYNQE